MRFSRTVAAFPRDRKSFHCRIFLFLAIICAGCTELPNDLGVRQHRSIAALTRKASHHPIEEFWRDTPGLKGKPRILVNLTVQQAFFYRGETLVGQTNISSGKRAYETPPGKYRIIQKDEHHVSSEYGAYVSTRTGAVLVRDVEINKTPMPAGAHFLGAAMPFFLRFTGGYGMHAGFVPRYRASHGCIRMPPLMAQHFFEAAEIGTPVEITEPKLAAAKN